jgi:hypothetical protein
MEFSSLNPYQSLEVIQADSPQGLIDELKQIRVPIKIVAIVQVGNRSVAYVMGDVRKNEIKRRSTKKEI